MLLDHLSLCVRNSQSAGPGGDRQVDVIGVALLVVHVQCDLWGVVSHRSHPYALPPEPQWQRVEPLAIPY